MESAMVAQELAYHLVERLELAGVLVQGLLVQKHVLELVELVAPYPVEMLVQEVLVELIVEVLVEQVATIHVGQSVHLIVRLLALLIASLLVALIVVCNVLICVQRVATNLAPVVV